MSLLDTASLIVTPNGYKEGTLYSVIPSDGSGDMSVVRATTATRVNSAGLVELVPYNLFTYSEQFDNADWSKRSNIAITANATTAPNGTLTADKMYLSNNSVADYGVFQILPNGSYNLSVYAKKAEIEYLFLGYNNDLPSNGVFYNLNTGVISLNTSGYSASITNEGNGWYRCSVTLPSLAYAFISPSTDGTTFIVTGQLNKGLYIWGAQLVEGTLPKDYQKTETRLNIPRLDYSNGTCPSLLVEPQRTNIALYSEDIAQTLPTNGGGTITANNTTAPNGVQTADKFTVDTSTGTHYFYNSYAVTNGQSYTTSIFLKKGTGRYFLYRILTNLNADRFGVTIDLETGTILSTNSIGTPTGTSSKIEDYGNGWYRVSLTVNGVGVLLATLLETSNTGTPTLDPFLDYSYTGNGTDTYYLWGMQIEAGSYPTSYIPTTSASVTRNADVVSKTGISSLIGQTEGTLFVDVDFSETSDYNGWFLKEASTYDTFAFIQRETSGIIAVGYYGSGALQARIETAPSQPSGRYKIAFGYKNNDFVLYINGTQIGTDTSGSVTGLMDFYDIHFGATGTNLQNASALWKTRLTNTQLAQLTTI